MENLVINIVSRQTLIDLNGIGPVLADRIIEARSFDTEADILAVHGIGQTSLNNIKSKNNIEFSFDLPGPTPYFHPFLEGELIMRNDNAGLGHWHAPRLGGELHQGIDILCTEGEPILSPINGVITKYGYPSSSKPILRYIEVSGVGDDSEYVVRPMYCIFSEESHVGREVSRGDLIGYAQSVSEVYGNPIMEDHIHFALMVDNVYVDPTVLVLG